MPNAYVVSETHGFYLKERPGTTGVVTPASEVQNVADYQAGWNDAQAKRAPRMCATIYYTNGFVDACAHEVRRPQ